jgi:hypothetical protein
VEALANEALYYKKEKLKEEFDESDDVFEQQVKDDCLRVIYRLLFIFYAESREDLDILPSNDIIYERGYSLEMLRELEQVPLYSDSSLNGYFFHESLSKLFSVLSSGYREKENGTNKSFRVRHIDSPLFNNNSLKQLRDVKFRNKVWQDIICRLSLSKQQKGKSRGRISYANLGINQLGSVYESLLAYRGFYAEQDYIEVHKANEPNDGTYLVPRSRRDDFEESEILKDENDETVIIKKGTFVYRLSGRDRQKSASYYTPEVLTQCTVKYTLKPILEKLDKGEMKATDLLELKLLEPAMGAAAFQNEMINQLAEAYLNYRQDELRKSGRNVWKVEPDKYREELQKVKAYIATNNVYGVDLNPTAIELGKLSLWLNVMHKEMETPFFSNRLAIGNAVIGAWLKVYKEKDISEEYEVIKDARGRDKRVLIKKEWWDTAPKQLEFKPGRGYEKIKHGRKQDEIYHFLLPDKNMVASSGIKMLKDEYEAEAKAVTKWRKEWIAPLKNSEIEQLKKISEKVDALLIEYYRFQRTINIQTASRQEIFAASKQGEARIMNLRTYDDKEKLSDQRNRHNAPYFKLKMVMDYWCSLWFWDMREALYLPNRQEFWNDIARILELDVPKAIDGVVIKKGQQKLFAEASQLSMAIEDNKDSYDENIFSEAVFEYSNRQNLFDNNQRLDIVAGLIKKYYFFHPQLEFLEVFWEKGGFDLIVGNPPWIKFTFEEKLIIAEKFPEVEIKKVSAPKVRSMQALFFSDPQLKGTYLSEIIEAESGITFMNAVQNYDLLVGQQTNLYKCVIQNGFSLINMGGLMGLLHPEGIYDDPNGQVLRKEVYKRLIFHFQFVNVLKLFSEILHWNVFGIQIYSAKKTNIDFISINNLFHPATIDGCFIHAGGGLCGGLKEKSDSNEGYVWNIKPHKTRIVRFDENRLSILARVFNSSENASGTKLVSIHSEAIFNVIEKLSHFKNTLSEVETRISDGWHETNDVDNKHIVRDTKFPSVDDYEMIYSGPHFYVANPLYKSPRKVCVIANTDYDIVDLSEIDERFIARSNYVPGEKKTEFSKIIKGFDYGHTSDKWIDHYKLGFRAMLSKTGERTLTSAIFPPRTSHINTITSIIFKEMKFLIEFAAFSSSIIADFYIKTIGKAGLYDRSQLLNMPIGFQERFFNHLSPRILMLNCLNAHYGPLWDLNFQQLFLVQMWSKIDSRLKPFDTLTSKWQWNIPLRNWYERRQALVEVDVIAAMAVGLTLEELTLVYNMQFPVLQQNEDDTWYDIHGNIVFTCSKGLTGVGVDRPIWEQIKSLKAGETFEHTVTKSELYYGKKTTYYAPFDKCDRVEDYKVAWAHFEKVFTE